MTANTPIPSTRPRRLVEDTPKISLKTLQLSGLFDPGGEGRVRLRVGEASFTFRRLDGGFTSKRHGRPAQTIRLVSRSLKFGERTYFVCPLAGDPCLDLFDVDGVLASRDAHKLSHRSRADPKAYAQKHTPAAAKPRLRRRRARSAAPAPVGHWRQARDSTIRGLEGGRELGLSEQTLAEILAPVLARARQDGPPCPLAVVLDTYWWASELENLDSDALTKAGLLKPGQIRFAALHWFGERAQGVNRVLAAFDLRSPSSPQMVLQASAGSSRSFQLICLVQQRGRWTFTCPVKGTQVRKLYLRQGGFASLQVQLAITGSKLPDTLADIVSWWS